MTNVILTAPAGFITGGIELLHQLGHELNKDEEFNAKIVYMSNLTKDTVINPKEYEKYGVKCYTHIDTLSPEDVIVFPEIWANKILDPNIKECIKIVFWESVDGYFQATKEGERYNFLKARKDKSVIHISQSEYASTFLNNLFIDNLYIGDYINDSFFKEGFINRKRKNQVLYNPKKITRQFLNLLERNKYEGNPIEFIPIVNLSKEEVIDLMKESKVYIDLGTHPGKDRLPREAAMCGCCIITNEMGAAGFDDIDIPKDYKIRLNYSDTQLAFELIKDIFINYDYHIKQF